MARQQKGSAGTQGDRQRCLEPPEHDRQKCTLKAGKADATAIDIEL
jgi:hypothetical protein